MTSLYDSALFRPPPGTCPGCHAPLRSHGDRCDRCGHHAWITADRFPWEPPPFDRFIDHEQRLTEADRAMVTKAVERLRAVFPQVHVHYCLVRLPEGLDARECGFWMFNASVPRSAAEAEARPWSVLVLIDRTAHAVSATAGYALDPFVSDRRLTAALEAGSADFAAGRYGAALVKVTDRLQRELVTCQREASYILAKLRQLVEQGTVSPAEFRDCRSLARNGDY